MPVWYTRQSSAEIVTDQVIEPSDFNNEYDAIVAGFVAAFSSTFGVGHGHTGTYGDGTLINLTGTAGVTGVTGVLASKYGGVQLSTTDPAVTDDVDSTPPHVVGSRWVNTTSKTTFICTDSTNGAAVWSRMQGIATAAAPTTANDITQGYQVGHIWVNTTSAPYVTYICISNATSAASWLRIQGTSSASTPAATNDISQGYAVGNTWLYTGVTPNVVYVCVSNVLNTAVWVPLAGVRVGTGTASPTSAESSTFGWREGSIFVDTVADQAYVCVDATAAAPVWKAIGESLWAVKTSAYSIVNGDKILASTTSGSFGLTAPTATTNDVVFEIADHDLTFDTNPVHLTGSFEGITGTFIIDVKGFSAKFVSKSSKFRII